MIETIVTYLRSAVDKKAKILPYNKSDDIPVYLRERFYFYKGTILNQDIFLIEQKAEDITLPAIKKNLNAIENILLKPVVIIFKYTSNSKRNKLIEEKIPFIISNRQMYLPFLGLELREIKQAKKDYKVKKNMFSPSEQLTYLYLLYNNIETSATQLASIFSYSVMTTSRALNTLYEKKLITYTIAGKTKREKRYRRADDPYYFQKGYKYLSTPIRYIIPLCEPEKIPGSLNAGLSALANMSMISPPRYEVKAVEHYELPTVTEPLEEMDFFKEPVIYVQVWRYDPRILSKTCNVDILSLKLSFSNDADERVQYELEKLLRSNKWYMD